MEANTDKSQIQFKNQVMNREELVLPLGLQSDYLQGTKQY